MFHDILFFLLGLALIVAGGNYLTDGATVIARKMHVSGLMIGLTVVAFGSSAPDLVVCMMSTIRNHSQLALGDVVGANIFDLLLVGGDSGRDKTDCNIGRHAVERAAYGSACFARSFLLWGRQALSEDRMSRMRSSSSRQ